MKRAYKITAIKNPRVDADHDAYCLPFKGKDLFGAYMMGISSFEAPERLYFLADFLTIPTWDFIDIDLTFPVLSNRMLETLTALGKFIYFTIPVTMIDDAYLDNPFNENGELKSGVPISNNYIALQLQEYADAFDYEKSVYRFDVVFPEDVGLIEKMILKEPPTGFTPLFKIKEAPQYLFVSETGKNELERNEIRGCCFEEIECSR